MPTKDINTATQQDLEQVPQMSSARAETIIHYREQHGRFKDMNELTAIPGIGDIMAQQMAEFFSVVGGADENEEGVNEDDEGVEDNKQSDDDSNKGGADDKKAAGKRRTSRTSSRS